jgi:hypothetical protein
VSFRLGDRNRMKSIKVSESRKKSAIWRKKVSDLKKSQRIGGKELGIWKKVSELKKKSANWKKSQRFENRVSESQRIEKRVSELKKSQRLSANWKKVSELSQRMPKKSQRKPFFKKLVLDEEITPKNESTVPIRFVRMPQKSKLPESPGKRHSGHCN